MALVAAGAASALAAMCDLVLGELALAIACNVYHQRDGPKPLALLVAKFAMILVTAWALRSLSLGAVCTALLMLRFCGLFLAVDLRLLATMTPVPAAVGQPAARPPPRWASWLW
jgi:hypothetical protein